MNKSLSYYVTGRDNNFNLIRFIAATLVLFSHCYPLFYGASAMDPLKKIVGFSLGTVAVDLFFISSGFLIAGSLYDRRDLVSFAKARILRIYPALAVCLVITVFLMGPALTTLPIIQYFTDAQTYIYFLKNLVLFFGEEAILPGLFAQLPWPNTVNGSLWTLPFEVRAYALLVLVAYVFFYCEMKWDKFPSHQLFLMIAVFGMGLYLYDYFYKIFPIAYFGAEYARLFSMFFIGVAYFKYKEKILLTKTIFFVAISSLFICMLNKDAVFVAYNLSLSYVVFYLAYIPKGVIRKFNNYGDYSYGIYIYAFLVQQSVMQLVPNVSFMEFFIISLVVTFVFAYFSWVLVEKKALSLKSKKLI